MTDSKLEHTCAVENGCKACAAMFRRWQLQTTSMTREQYELFVANAARLAESTQAPPPEAPSPDRLERINNAWFGYLLQRIRQPATETVQEGFVAGYLAGESTRAPAVELAALTALTPDHRLIPVAGGGTTVAFPRGLVLERVTIETDGTVATLRRDDGTHVYLELGAPAADIPSPPPREKK